MAAHLACALAGRAKLYGLPVCIEHYGVGCQNFFSEVNGISIKEKKLDARTMHVYETAL